MNRDAAAALGLLATIFSMFAFATSLALQRGCCKQAFFVVLCGASGKLLLRSDYDLVSVGWDIAFFAFITSTIIGGFMEDVRPWLYNISGQPVL
jgi:hypothetical protein